MSPASAVSDDVASSGASQVYDDVATAILGAPARYDRNQVSALTGIPVERLSLHWRALGFPSPDDEPIFTDADIAALQRLHTLIAPQGLAEGEDLAIIRTMGRTFARLADWEVSLLTSGLAEVPMDDLAGAVRELLPEMQALQDYVWRRHLAGSASRALLGTPTDGADLGVGFVDMVNFTKTSRKLTTTELGVLVERFEATASALVAARGGRVIKTIGDEVLFVTDSPADAADVALALAALHESDPDFPQVRGGIAWGPVLQRLGDVFGETVNIAARLTSLARPGTVLANHDLAELVADTRDVRRIPSERVRGYNRLEAWVVRAAEPVVRPDGMA